MSDSNDLREKHVREAKRDGVQWLMITVPPLLVCGYFTYHFLKNENIVPYTLFALLTLVFLALASIATTDLPFIQRLQHRRHQRR